MVCTACGEDDHKEGSLVCAYTPDSCALCGGYHDSFLDCTEEE